MEAYIGNFAFRAEKLTSPPQIDEKDFATDTLNMAQTDAELGAFHRSTRDMEDARTFIDEALKEDPKLGLAHEEKGFLLFADGKDAEASSEFSQAFALDARLYLSLFFKTMLSPIAQSDAPADQVALHDALEKVMELNPRFAPAYIQLARLDLRQINPKIAFDLVRTAEKLEPSRAGYHLLTGQILLRLGKGTEASGFAKFVADRWVGPDHDEAVELWNSVPEDQRPKGESLAITSPPHTKTLARIVKSLNCTGSDQAWSLVLDHDGQTLTFHRKGGFPMGYSDTIWYGEDHFSLCYHIAGLRAVVSYNPPADASYAGDVAELGIRKDLPANIADASRGTSATSNP